MVFSGDSDYCSTRIVPALSWLTGPATVALALSLYRQWRRLRGIWWPVMGSLFAGSVAAVVSAIGIAWLLGGETVIGFAALAMGLNAIATSLLVRLIDGRRLRLGGLATIQNATQAGTLVVRIKFTELDSQ